MCIYTDKEVAYSEKGYMDCRSGTFGTWSCMNLFSFRESFFRKYRLYRL